MPTLFSLLDKKVGAEYFNYSARFREANNDSNWSKTRITVMEGVDSHDH